MFTELTSFVERLQDSAASIARLEAENEKQREELERAKQASSPQQAAEVAELRQRLGDLTIRLTGAEQARDASVEVRMRQDLALGSHADELAKLRSELASSRAELAAHSQQVADAQQQVAALRAEITAAQAAGAELASQLDARQRIAADSAKSLRAIAAMLEG